LSLLSLSVESSLSLLLYLLQTWNITSQ